jgi:[acyl-carrier-protein] S-malonyltransferase
MAIAFVFPGQGSQFVGMLSELAAAYPDVRRIFGEASTALGYDLWALVSQGPEERLAQTEITQPAMLTAGVAIWRVWRARCGTMPRLMAGHSLGEYTALVCAGALGFADAVALVADRARYMQAAVPQGQGTIAAILGLEDDVVRTICKEAAEGEVVEPVNFNSPAQVIIAGDTSAVARAIERLKAAGAKRAIPLPMSVPAHSSLMKPAAVHLAERLSKMSIRSPEIPVIHNAHLQTVADPAAIREALVRQLASPVRWVETVQKMSAQGVKVFIECGPGKVLTGLNRRIERAAKCLAINDAATLDEALSYVAQQGSTESACR